jgi:Tol biopolymer transport system component
MTDPREPRLRALMERLAQGAPAAGDPPRRLIQRAQRRAALTVVLTAAAVVLGVTSSVYLATRSSSSEESKPISPDQGPRAMLEVISQDKVGTLDVDAGRGLLCYEIDGVRGATSAEIRTEGGSRLELFTSNGNPNVAASCKHNVDGDQLLALIERPDDHTLRFHNSESGGVVDATLRVTDTNVDGPARIGWIAFLRGGGRGQHIHLVRPDGTDLTRLPVDRFYGSSLTWSPHGESIAFERGISEGHHDVVRMDVDGTDQMVILTDRGRRRVITAQGLDWAPDGSRLAFSNGGGDIYLMDTNGEDLQKVTRSGLPCADLDVSWSPDATSVVLARDCVDRQGQSSHIQLLNLATGARTDITEGPSDTQPDWSPDGTRIAFTRDHALFVMRADGSDPHRVSGMSEVFDVDWSPDGRALVFSTGRGRVAFVDVSTRHITRLTSGPGDQSPVWGP